MSDSWKVRPIAGIVLGFLKIQPILWKKTALNFKPSWSFKLVVPE